MTPRTLDDLRAAAAAWDGRRIAGAALAPLRDHLAGELVAVRLRLFGEALIGCEQVVRWAVHAPTSPDGVVVDHRGRAMLYVPAVGVCWAVEADRPTDRWAVTKAPRHLEAVR